MKRLIDAYENDLIKGFRTRHCKLINEVRVKYCSEKGYEIASKECAAKIGRNSRPEDVASYILGIAMRAVEEA